MFEPNTPLEVAIHSGDADATLTLLRDQTADQRASHRAGLKRMLKLVQAAHWGAQPGEWGEKPTPAQRQSLSAAIVLCGTAEDVVEAMVDDDLLVALGREWHPRSLDGLVQAMLAHSPHWIRTAQRLISAGLAPRPDSDGYTLGLMALPYITRSAERLKALFDADAGLRPALLRVFSVEGTADVSLASSDKYNHVPELAWGRLLLSLVDDGLTTRAELLDLTLGALEKDWPQFRAGWFSRFHAELAPEPTAMQPHLSRYLGLCASRIPPTVALSLDALRQLDAAHPIEGAALLAALRPVMASSVKGQLEAAMKLLDRLVQREPALSTRASDVAAMGLLHNAAPVQAQVLRRLETWGVDDALRARLPDFMPGLAATNRSRLTQLIGDDEAAIEPDASQSSSRVTRPAHPLDDGRRLPAPGDLQELVECIAHVFEHANDVDAFERAAARLVEVSPIAEADKPLFAPVRKRAAKMQRPLPRGLARLLLFVLDGTGPTGRAVVDHAASASLAEQLLSVRIDDLIAVAAQGRHLPPLSAPTHRGGFIAAEIFIQRVAAHRAAGLLSSRAEQVLGLLRLCPDGSRQLCAAAQRLPDGALTQALRYALHDDVAHGDDAELFAAAARIRHPREDDRALDARHAGLGPDGALAARWVWRTESDSHEVEGKTYTHHKLFVDVLVERGDVPPERLAVLRHPSAGATGSWGRPWTFAGFDEGAIRYSATLLPSDPGAYFAEGARVVGNNLDWWEAQWQNRAYLDMLLDPVAPMTPIACLLLVLGLAGKEPGQGAISVDALVQAHADGRLGESGDLADALRALLATPLLKAARLHKSLLAAIRADAAISSMVFHLLCAALQARPEDPPRDTALLLDLLLELKISGARALPAAARQALAAMKLTGNGRKLQQRLMA